MSLRTSFLAAILLAGSFTHAHAQQAVAVAADIRPGDDFSFGTQLQQALLVGDEFIISGTDSSGYSGIELVGFDPNSGVLRLIKDVFPGPQSGSRSQLTELDGDVYFTAVGGFSEPFSLYRYQPSSDEVSVIPAYNDGDNSALFPQQLVSYAGKLYYVANLAGQRVVIEYTPSTGDQRMVHTHTPNRTIGALLADANGLYIMPANFNGDSMFHYVADSLAATAVNLSVATGSGVLTDYTTMQNAVISNGHIYFRSFNPAYGDELISIDLTTDTFELFDLLSGSGSSGPYVIYPYGDKIYTAGIEQGTGEEGIYAVDPIQRSAQFISVTGMQFPSFRNFFGFGDFVYLTASTPGTGGEPYRLNINTLETEFLGDLFAGPNWSDPNGYLVYNEQLYVHLSTLETGGEYHRFNPQSTEFELVADNGVRAASSYPNNFYSSAEFIYFQALDEENISELFRYSATTGAVEQITNLNFSQPEISRTFSETIEYNGTLYFATDAAFGSVAYHALDLTTLNAQQIYGFNGFAFGPSFSNPQILDDKIYFISSVESDGNSVKIIDPSTNSLSALNTVAAGFDTSAVSKLYIFNGELVFVARSDDTGFEIFRYNPTDNTVSAYDLVPGVVDSYASIIALTDTHIYLQWNHAPSGETVHRIDVNGTVEPLVDSQDIVGSAAVFGNYLVSHSFDSSIDVYNIDTAELTVIEGAPEGGPFFNGEFVTYNDSLLVLGNSTAFGQGEFYEVKPESAEVSLFGELNPGLLGGNIFQWTLHQGGLYFNGERPDVGNELFRYVDNSAPEITVDAPTSVLQDSLYTATFSATDADNDELTFSISSNLPAWLTFDAAQGTLSGTPGNAKVGVYSDLVISVSDGSVTVDSAPFSIEVVNVNDAPTISGTPATSVFEGQAYSFVPTASDVDNDQLTFSIINMPQWATFDSATGALTGTPNFDQAGSYSNITISVSDGTASTALPAFSITVNNVNRAPVISGTPVTSASEGVAYSFVPSATDADNDPLVFAVINEPVWASFDPATGALTGTPGFEDAGSYPNITIFVTDGVDASAIPEFTITVANVNQAPEISGTPATSVDENMNYSFMPVGTDGDDDQLIYSIVNKPVWATFDTNSGLLSGTPSFEQSGSYNNIVISVSDGASSAALPAFSITVNNVNRAPEISGTPTTSVNEGEAYTFVPTATDADDDMLSFSIANKPAWVGFDAVSGMLTGTPDFDQAGNYSNIIITASDGTDSTALTAFSITVNNVNRAPVISGTPVTSASEGVAYSFVPSATDADNDPLVFAVINEPAWASFDPATGALTGTPGFDDAGSYPNITIFVTAGVDASAIPEFTITVANVNQAPTISGNPPTQVTAGQLYSFTVIATDPDLDDEVSFSMQGNPAWLSISQTGVVSGTPSEQDVAMTGPITITASDLAGATAELAPFQIDVVSANLAPRIIESSTPGATQGQPYVASFTASDEELSTLSWQFVGLPSWLSVTQQTGATATVSGTPDQAAVTGSPYAFTVRVVDDRQQSAEVTAQIAVADVNIAPVWTMTPPTTATQGVLYSAELTASDADNDQVSFSALILPSWLTLEGSLLSGTPEKTDVGVSGSVILFVNDGNGGEAGLPPFNITVANVNEAPEITNSPATTATVGEAYNYTPTVSDPDSGLGDGETFTFSIENKPTWADFDTSTGALTGTPTADDIAEWAGIGITVTDSGGLTDSVGPFTIEVTASNTPPRAMDDSFSITAGEAMYRLDVLTNDEDDGDTLRIVGVTQPVDGVTVSIVDGALELRGIASNFSGTLNFSYTIRDSANEESSAQVAVTVASASAIVITVPADIEVNATALYTRVPLGSATAVDGEGRRLRVKLVNGSLFFAPGKHTILWQATDANGVTASKTQQVVVHPLVSLGRNQAVSADTPFSVEVKLNGLAPSYPFNVKVTVNNVLRTVTFANGSTSALLQFDGISSAVGTLVVRLTDGVNSGSQTTSTVVVVEAPKITAAQLAQTKIDAGDTLSGFFRLNTREALTVQVKFVNSADSSQSFAFDDIAANANLLSLLIPLDATPGLYDSTIELLRGDQVVDVKRVQRLIVGAGAQIGGLSADAQGIDAFEYAPGDDDLSRELDQNDNGLVDYEDGRWDANGNAIAAYLDRAITQQQIWTGSAFALSAGDSLLRALPTVFMPGVDAADIRASQAPSMMSVQAVVDVDDYQFIGDFYSFEVALADDGEQAQVVLPLDQPLADGASLLLWRAGAWHSFELDANEQVFSAGAVQGFCPDAGAVEWQPGLSEGHWCVQMQLNDGGINDADGAADSVVQVFVGAAYANSGNTAPVAVTDSATVIWRGSASIAALENDIDADGDELSIISATVTGGTVTVNAAGTHLNYVTDGDLGGDFVITYVVSDHNGGIAVGTVNVTVLDNRAPMLGADSTVTPAGRPVTVNVLANDADPDGDALTVIGADPENGSVSFTASTVTFTPAAGFTGVAAVSYTVSDGRGGESVGTLNVQVNAAVEVIEVRPASGAFAWWLLALGGLLLAGRRRLV